MNHKCPFKRKANRDSLVVQELRLCTSMAGAAGSIPSQGTKILYALWCSQRKERKADRDLTHGEEGDVKTEAEIRVLWPQPRNASSEPTSPAKPRKQNAALSRPPCCWSSGCDSRTWIKGRCAGHGAASQCSYCRLPYWSSVWSPATAWECSFLNIYLFVSGLGFRTWDHCIMLSSWSEQA